MDNKAITEMTKEGIDPRSDAHVTWSPEWRKFLSDEPMQLLPDGMPLFNWLEISPTELCNRRCEVCPRRDPLGFPSQPLTMDPKLYRKMADELGDLNYRGIVVLSGYGEPLLSRHIYDMAATFSRVAHQVKLVTSGDRLNVDSIAKLLDAGITMFLVSLYDGPAQVDDFHRMFSAAHVPEYGYVLRPRWDGPDRNFGVKLTNRAGMVQSGNQPPVNVDHLCYYPHYAMTLDWNGDVLLCCQDWNRRVKAGNVASQTLLEVWGSRVLDRYRRRLATGQRDLAPCCNCNADGTLHGAGHREAWERYYARGAA